MRGGGAGGGGGRRRDCQRSVTKQKRFLPAKDREEEEEHVDSGKKKHSASPNGTSKNGHLFGKTKIVPSSRGTVGYWRASRRRPVPVSYRAGVLHRAHSAHVGSSARYATRYSQSSRSSPSVAEHGIFHPTFARSQSGANLTCRQEKVTKGREVRRCVARLKALTLERLSDGLLHVPLRRHADAQDAEHHHRNRERTAATATAATGTGHHFLRC
jgi:hypothetical protein